MGIVCLLLDVVVLTLIAWIILSYVAAYGRLPWGHPIRKFYDSLNKLIQPVLEPIRRVLPPLRIGAMALDLSPIVIFIGISILRSVIC